MMEVSVDWKSLVLILKVSMCIVAIVNASLKRWKLWSLLTGFCFSVMCNHYISSVWSGNLTVISSTWIDGSPLQLLVMFKCLMSLFIVLMYGINCLGASILGKHWNFLNYPIILSSKFQISSVFLGLLPWTVEFESNDSVQKLIAGCAVLKCLHIKRDVCPDVVIIAISSPVLERL